MEQEKRYLGIPRTLIPWYPHINVEACVKGCDACATHCKHDVYSLNRHMTGPVVANPYNCEVFCQSCQYRCEADAISFPDKESVKAVVRELRKQYPLE